MPRILNPEVLSDWSEEDIKELQRSINEMLRGFPKGIYYFILYQPELPNISDEEFVNILAECSKPCEILEKLEELKEKYGTVKQPFYVLHLVGEVEPEVDNAIVLKVRKYR